MTYLKLIFLFILVLLDRCGIIRRPASRLSPEEKYVRVVNVSPNGTWRLSEPTDTLAVYQKDSIGNTFSTEPEVATIISIFPDSTFTELKSDGTYLPGTWKHDSSDSSITLIKKGNSFRYRTSFGNESNGLRLMKLTDDKNENLQFAGFGKALDQYKEDPYYSSNNNWRIKSEKPEDKQQVLARLRGYLLHSALILKAAETRKQQIISWEFYQGILRIYRGGIGLKPIESIPETWIASFHSRKEAYLAYAILEDFLVTTTYKGKATGNWVTDDYQILMSTYERLKTRNLASVKAI